MKMNNLKSLQVILIIIYFIILLYTPKSFNLQIGNICENVPTAKSSLCSNKFYHSICPNQNQPEFIYPGHHSVYLGSDMKPFYYRFDNNDRFTIIINICLKQGHLQKQQDKQEAFRIKMYKQQGNFNNPDQGLKFSEIIVNKINEDDRCYGVKSIEPILFDNTSNCQIEFLYVTIRRVLKIQGVYENLDNNQEQVQAQLDFVVNSKHYSDSVITIGGFVLMSIFILCGLGFIIGFILHIKKKISQRFKLNEQNEQLKQSNGNFATSQKELNSKKVSV